MALSHYQATAVDAAGNILSSATITVRRESDGGLATLKADRAGTTGKNNPFTISSLDDGQFDFYVAGGAYKITVGSGSLSRTLRYVALGTAAEYDTGASLRQALSLAYTGTVAGRLARFTGTTGEQGQTTGLFEDSIGRVGSGITSPTAQHHIVNATAGRTALSVAGVAGGLNLDFNGSGNSYYDSAKHYFRSANGSVQYGYWAAGVLTVQGGGAAGFNQLSFVNDTPIAYQFGLGGSTSAQPNKFFIYTSSAGFVLVSDASGNFGFGTSTPTCRVDVVGPIRCGSYTVGTVPSASAVGAGAQIYVTNESGGAVLAFSDGTNWRRVTDRAVIT